MTRDQEDEQHAESLGLDRIVFFSDAVIAIAITLLALDIRLPELDQTTGEALREALWDLWPNYLSYLISFFVIGNYWLVHHRIFRVVRRYDERLIWLNLLFLACVAFLPFASSVLGEHGDERAGAIFYALCVAATGLANASMWLYASYNGRLLGPSYDPIAVRLGTLRSLTAPTVFLLSIPLIWVNPTLGALCWFLPFPVISALRRRQRMAGSPELARGVQQGTIEE